MKKKIWVTMIILIINILKGNQTWCVESSNTTPTTPTTTTPTIPYNIFGEAITHNIPKAPKDMDLFAKDYKEQYEGIWEKTEPISAMKLDGASILNPLTNAASGVPLAINSGQHENITTKILWRPDHLYITINIKYPGKRLFSSCPCQYRTPRERTKAMELIQSAPFVRVAFDKNWSHKTIHVLTHNINGCTISEKIIFDRNENHMQPLLNVDMVDSYDETTNDDMTKNWRIDMKIPISGTTIESRTNWRMNVEFIHVAEKKEKEREEKKRRATHQPCQDVKRMLQGNKKDDANTKHDHFVYAFYRWVPMHNKERPYWYGLIKFNHQFKNDKLTLSSSEKTLVQIEQLLFSIYEAQQQYHKKNNQYATTYEQLAYALGADVQGSIHLAGMESSDKTKYFTASLRYNNYLYSIHEYKVIETRQLKLPSHTYWVMIIVSCAVILSATLLAMALYQPMLSLIKKRRHFQKKQNNEQHQLLFQPIKV